MIKWIKSANQKSKPCAKVAFNDKKCILHVILAQIILLYLKIMLTLHTEFFI